MQAAILLGTAAAYKLEWAEFLSAQGINGQPDIPDAFKSNVDKVKTHNSKNSSYKLTYTGAFAALSEDEFVAQYTGLGDISLAHQDVPNFGETDESPLADSVDWVQKGAVNPIKNQGSCGSCWAFSTVGTLESAFKISAGTLHSLAEQQLVDCDKADGGCGGGWPHSAYDNYYTGAGVCSEDSYKYTAKDGSCRASSCTVALPSGTVTGHHNVPQTSSGLKSAIASQPISVTVNAGQLQLYANGVVTGDCSGQINHAVMAVGYGMDGQSYFNIRNSWGTSWGEAGYIRLAQSGGSQGTACLLQYAPVTPALSTSPIPTPPPTPPSPTPPAPSPTPTPSGNCHAISSVATDDWCAANCAMGNCPADLCKCDSILV